MNIDLDVLRKRYDNLPIRNESTVKNQIVIPFLEMLNYKSEWITTEVPILSPRNRADIVVFPDKKKDYILIVEVKKPDREIEDSDKEQLLNYMSINNIEWGLISNGRIYILLNCKIDGNYLQKEIFHFNLKDSSTEYVLKYFSYEKLFKYGVVKYFKDLKQFKIYKFENKDKSNDRSWLAYEGTLRSFFTYMAEKDEYYLESIRPSIFKDYLLNSINEKKSINARYARSRSTILNQYRHIIGFYDTLKANKNYVTYNPFETITEDKMLDDIDYDTSEREFEPLSEEEANVILKAFEMNRSDIRNKLIFLLILYAGLDRGEIKELKVSDVTDNNNLIVGTRVIPLPDSLMDLIGSYIEERKKKKIDSDYLFCAKYAGVFGRMSDNAFNALINKALSDTCLSNKRKYEISPYFIKESLVKRLFQCGFHIEDIVYLTGLSLGTISNYITNVDIENIVSLKRLTKKHPYIKFFE